MKKTLLFIVVVWLALLTIIQVTLLVRIEKLFSLDDNRIRQTVYLPNYNELTSRFQGQWQIHPRQTFSSIFEKDQILTDRLWKLESTVDRVEKLIYAPNTERKLTPRLDAGTARPAHLPKGFVISGMTGTARPPSKESQENIAKSSQDGPDASTVYPSFDAGTPTLNDTK